MQHALLALFDLVKRGELSAEVIVERTSHAPADIFGVKERGYVREGWFADLVIIDSDKPHVVGKEPLLYKCQWSPFEGHTFSASIDTTIINGNVVYREGKLTGVIEGQRPEFDRPRSVFTFRSIRLCWRSLQDRTVRRHTDNGRHDSEMKRTDTSNPDYFHKVVDCQWACPAHTDVPQYIRLIAQGRFDDAYILTRESTVFPGILGRGCDRPC